MNKFNLLEATIKDIHKAYLEGTITCRMLCEEYINRINTDKQRSLSINSIICINPDIITEAEEKDSFIKDHHYLCGPLHGIPILLKDNFETQNMPTTAGSIALDSWMPKKDASVVQRLRKAGAIVLAKTNLHEFALGGTTVSSVLGQSVNPYDFTRTPGGSSGGTAAAIASNIGVIGLGTDTVNSVRSPASANNLVGIRPTMGLISRDGVIPYSSTQDAVGPICRTVEDAVRCLDVITGYDKNDTITSLSIGKKQGCYLDYLDRDALQGKRIGILESLFGKDKINVSTNKVVCEALKVFEKNGVQLVSIAEFFDQEWLKQETSVNLEEFQFNLNQYLKKLPPEWSVHSLQEILAYKLFHPFVENKMKVSTKLKIDSPRYMEKMKNKVIVRNRILKLMNDLQLDAMVYPHQQQLVCKIGNQQEQRNGVLCSSIGFPSICVPAGFASDKEAPIGIPVGIELMGLPWSEPLLISLAYAFEQHSFFRRPPTSAL